MGPEAVVAVDAVRPRRDRDGGPDDERQHEGRRRCHLGELHDPTLVDDEGSTQEEPCEMGQRDHEALGDGAGASREVALDEWDAEGSQRACLLGRLDPFRDQVAAGFAREADQR